jgi:hypothetical protein
VGSTGRPRCRWERDVRQDVRRMRVQNWTERTMGRAAQNIIFSKSKLINSCSAKGKGFYFLYLEYLAAD